MYEMEAEMLKNLITGLQNAENIPSDMILKARRLINTPKGREILKNLESQGITQESIAKMFNPPPVPKKNGILIRPNGMMKNKMITNDEPLEGSDIQSTTIVINNITITAWYDAKIKCINKRASKLLNMNVGGQVVLTAEQDLSINMF